jgi:hypothetical protein
MSALQNGEALDTKQIDSSSPLSFLCLRDVLTTQSSHQSTAFNRSLLIYPQVRKPEHFYSCKVVNAVEGARCAEGRGQSGRLPSAHLVSDEAIDE